MNDRLMEILFFVHGFPLKDLTRPGGGAGGYCHMWAI